MDIRGRAKAKVSHVAGLGKGQQHLDWKGDYVERSRNWVVFQVCLQVVQLIRVEVVVRIRLRLDVRVVEFGNEQVDKYNRSNEQVYPPACEWVGRLVHRYVW